MNRKVLSSIAIFAAALGWDLLRRAAVGRNKGIARGKRFVIVGGGFAGIEASRELERLLPGDDNGEIVLVDQHDYLLFTPMLTEAVGGQIAPQHIIVPLDSFIERTRRITGCVEQIRLEDRSVAIRGAHPAVMNTNHLVLALGSTSNFHGIPGAEEKAVTMKTIDDANRVRESALSLIEQAGRATDPNEREAMLTFLVAGGGYTGVETIAALNEMVRERAEETRTVSASEIRMILAEPAERLMSEVSEDLASYTQRELERAGIRVLLKTGVKRADGDSIELSNGEMILARTFIWSAGVEANKLIATLDAPKGKSKGLKVGADLAMKEYAGVWAVGDSAEVPQPGGGTYGATAQNASREGKHVARNIVRQLRGEELKPFRYKPIGELALVGQRRGVASVYGMKFSGFTAYILWRAVYLLKMPSMQQRLRVVADWIVDAVAGPTGRMEHSPGEDVARNGVSKLEAGCGVGVIG